MEDRPFAKSTMQVFRAQLILHDKVREVFESSLRLARNQAPAPNQADALTSEALARIRETARLPRRGCGGRMETPAAALARAAVDLAIIGVMADGGLRRSEAAALTWGRRRMVGGRHRPHHHPEGEEPA